MTEAIAFDTHRFVKNLTAGGFTEKQAETLADEQVHLLNANPATKADIQAVKADIQAVKADIQAVKADLQVEIQTVKADLQVGMQTVKADLQVEIQTVKADLLKWMVTAMTAQTGVILGLAAGLIRLFWLR